VKRAVLFLRVSTEEQKTDVQRDTLERLAAARGYTVVRVFDEKMSGAATRRPEFDAMMAFARKTNVDAIFIWAIDRLGRSMIGVTNAILELDRREVDVISHSEAWLDTASPVRPLLIAVFSWVAEFERKRIIERTNAGLDRARASGVKLGRPRAHVPMSIAIELQRQGQSIRQIADALHLHSSSVQRALERFKNGTDKSGPKVPRIVPTPPPHR
jgi:DNA invertase Pin-like site-specific DNA recombinase